MSTVSARHITLTALLAMLGCRQANSVEARADVGPKAVENAAPSMSSKAAARGESALMNDAQLESQLCAVRPNCRTRSRRPVPGQPDVELVELSLAANADGGSGCAQAEYWLVRRSAPSSFRRLAHDCDEQWGPDGRGHATMQFDGANLQVAYQEMQEGDSCEGYDATLSTSPLRVIREARWDGSVLGGRCKPLHRIQSDWATGRHSARWNAPHCGPPGVLPPREYTGAVIPRVALAPGVDLAATSLGSCSVTLEPQGGRSVGLRAVVADDALVTEVEAVSGTLRVFAAEAALGDGSHGSVGCQSASERPVHMWTMQLSDGKVEASRGSAQDMTVLGRAVGALRIKTRLSSTTSRLAVSYEDGKGGRIASTEALRSPSTVGLPPILTVAERDARCEVIGGRLELHRPERRDPMLALRPDD